MSLAKKKDKKEEDFQVFSQGYIQLLQLFGLFLNTPSLPGIKKEMEKLYEALLPYSKSIGGKLFKDFSELRKPLLQFMESPVDLESLQRSLSIMEGIRNEIAEL